MDSSKLSKQDLKIENANLCYEVQQRDALYEESRSIIEKLDREYDASKASAPLARYGRLKLIIKEATTEENLEKAKPIPSGEKIKNGSGSLLQKVKEFRGNVEKVDMLNDAKYEKMTKQEIARENDEKKKALEVLQRKSLRTFNRLDKLKRDYDASKQLSPYPRYSRLKEMVKEVTYDTYI